MSRFLLGASCLCLLFLGSNRSSAQEEKKDQQPVKENQGVEKLTDQCRKSVAVIRVTGRTGKQEGIGTGFIISADGLIATNLHVIGEARPISVQLADGKKYDVTEVHATDRAADLAVIKIDAKDLTPLKLGNSEQLKQGMALVALGNPLGLEHSVVTGVLSGQRDIEGKSMLQLAMPVEPGNSGGPVVDLQGRVVGVVTMKSAVAANLGFAVPINALKPLLAKPNPVALERWLTIGAIDPEEWETLFGARWRQRAGRISVEGSGTGFGGRSLLLSKRPLPDLPFEVTVQVKLDDESGAAGLVFHADGKNKHYGFYPTSGGVRLTRFEGPDVFSWKILMQDKTPHYRLGNWNTLKVRVEKEKLLCYINDQLIFESNDTGLTSGMIGLCKFRETHAEFKGFRVAKEIPPTTIPPEVQTRINKTIGAIQGKDPPKSGVIDKLVPDGSASVVLLRDRARQLEEQAALLRELALSVHQKRVQSELAGVFKGKEEDIDLLHAALLIARLDNDELDIDIYRQEIDRVGKKLAAGLPKDADEKARLAALNNYLFTERGYHGSRGDYYNKANSYLNEVIDDREGLPITLSVLYIEIGRRMGLKLVGVGLPGHFVVRTAPAEGHGQLIDVYEGGKLLSREDAEARVLAITGQKLREEFLAPMAKKAIIVRMINNLLGIARRDRDGTAMLRYLDAILTVTPDAADERWIRAVLRFQAGDRTGSLGDVDWLLEHKPEGIDLDRLRELQRLLKEPE